MTSDRIARLRQMANCVTFSEREQEDIRWVCRVAEEAHRMFYAQALDPMLDAEAALKNLFAEVAP